jgi:isoleucyl-tRNA synthetase
MTHTTCRATRQWFANVETIREDALKAMATVHVIPATGTLTYTTILWILTMDIGLHRMTSYLHERTEWCISRQRAWGVPIPVFYDVETDEPLINDQTIEHIIQLVEKHGTDCWWEMPIEELLPPSYRQYSKYR